LPYAFASHFAPDDLMAALATYRAGFKPSAQLAAPYAMVGVNAVVADTDAAARRLFTSVQQGVTNLLRGARGRLQPPIDDIEAYWSPAEKAHASRMLACSYVGSPAAVRAGLAELVARTGADELIVAAGIFDQTARLRSYELLAELMR
jgi:luciferase family oxidoreductase group 1